MNKVTKVALLLLVLSGCRNRISDIVGYAEDPANGLRKETRVGAVAYSFQYRPAAYTLRMEQVADSLLPARRQQLEGMAWFTIRIQVPGFGQSPLRYGIGSLEEYTARQDYYLNAAAKDIYMRYGSDTLYVNSYWFENNQNLTPYETIIVGFRLPATDKVPERDMQLSFHDRVFKNGIIKTIITRDAVAPTLSL